MAVEYLEDIFEETGSVATAIDREIKADIDLAKCTFGLSADKKPELRIKPDGSHEGLLRSVTLLGKSTREAEMAAATILAAKHDYCQTDINGYPQVEARIRGVFTFDQKRHGHLKDAKVEDIDQDYGFEIHTDCHKTIHVDRIRYTNIPGNDGKGFSAEVSGVDRETKLPIILSVIADRDGQVFQEALKRQEGIGSLTISGTMTVAGNHNGLIATITESNFNNKLELEVGRFSDRPAPEMKSYPILPNHTVSETKNSFNQLETKVHCGGPIVFATGHFLNSELKEAIKEPLGKDTIKQRRPQMQGEWETKFAMGKTVSAFRIKEVYNPYREQRLSREAEKTGTTLLDICNAGYTAAATKSANPHLGNRDAWCAFESGKQLWLFREQAPAAIEFTRDHLEPLGYSGEDRQTALIRTVDNRNHRLTLFGDDLSRGEIQLVQKEKTAEPANLTAIAAKKSAVGPER